MIIFLIILFNFLLLLNLSNCNSITIDNCPYENNLNSEFCYKIFYKSDFMNGG